MHYPIKKACLTIAVAKHFSRTILMHEHFSLASNNEARKKTLGQLIRAGEITLGGNKKEKIYGLLRCSSGKKMKIENRIFFTSERRISRYGTECFYDHPDQQHC